MNKLIRSLAVYLLGVAVMLPEISAGASLPGPVVDAKWLNAHKSEVIIVDVRDDLSGWVIAPRFIEDEKTGLKTLSEVGGHIEGALALDFGQVRASKSIEGKKIDKLLPGKAEVQELFQAAGINRGRPIVITSPGEAIDQIEAAARVYWTFKYYGAEQLALLDGGNAAWLSAGFPVSTSAQGKLARGSWEATAERREMLAEAADVELAIKNKVQIVDARPLPQYLGLFYKKPSVSAGGHLEGARNFPGDVRFRSSGVAQVFLTAEEYRGVLKATGIAAQAPTVTYCNTGHMASGAWFIQSEILGTKNVRLYDGSMHEWTTLGKPVVGLGG